jgi:glycosyltransferase involved in cell wall biosynthesis
MALKRDKTDLAHVQYTVPLMSTVPVVTTIADITFKLFPELFTFKDRTLLNLSIPASIKRSAAVICVSENTRNDILKAYPDTPSNKAIAIHNGIGSEFTPASVEDIAMFRDRVKEQYNIDGDYVLSVGVLQPRKNAPLLIRAFLKAKADGNLPHRLVIVGKRGWLSDQTEKAIADAGENVIFAGYAADDDLRALYCCADCLAYPSLYEGFGLPPAEAMACGCPVIAGNTSSLPEVVGDAGLLVDPKNQDAWSEALVCLLTDARLRETLAQKGLRQVKRFSWITAAQKTLLVYRSVLEKA